jgi:hypothetical protein
MIRVLFTEIPKEFVPVRLTLLATLSVLQQNILLTNDTPPRACLSEFSCMTLDSGEPIPFDVQLGHGTTEFKSPERFNPQRFGIEYALVTREADIYAFGMTIFQVPT